MPVPQPRSLSLGEAAYYVADCCGLCVEKAKAALDRAFREYSVLVFSDRSPFEKIQGWQGAEIDWENSTVVGGEPRTIDGVHYTVRVSVFRQHLDEWIAQASAAPGRSPTISLDDASGRIGRAKFGADWIGKLTERDRWLIKRYVQMPSSNRPGGITYIGPGGPIVPVNDRALAAEVERARDRHEQMNDQYDQVFSWLEDHGFDCESDSLDLARFDRAFAAAFAAEVKRVLPEAKSDPGSRGRHRNRRAAAIERQLKALGTPPEALAWKPFCDAVRKDCGVTLKTYGYGDKSIQRAVSSIRARQDKRDNSDMSNMS